jgi:uncharacterized DUF497 family protein
MRFEWDEAKGRLNIKKHGVSFNEAKTVFYDDYAKLIVDSEHSNIDEERFILIGLSLNTKVLVVCHCHCHCHCYRQSNEIIRIISARKATRKENEQYLEGRT